MVKKFNEVTEKYLKPKIYSYIPKLDKILGKKEVNIEKRSMLVAEYLLKQKIVQYRARNNNISEEEIKEKAFTFILIIVNDWYEEKYGNFHKDDNQMAHLYINGIVYKLSIPLYISNPTGDGKTSWMHIPDSISKDEDTLDWIVNKPNFKMLDNNEIAEFRNQINKIGNALRKLNVSRISVGELSKKENDAFLNVISSFSTISDTFINYPENKSAMMWNIQFAVEEMLKFSLMKKNISVPKTHDLNKLYANLYPNLELSSIRFFNIFPHANDAIRERYSSSRTLQEINDFYIEALEFCSELAKDIEKIIDISKIELKIKYAFAL